MLAISCERSYRISYLGHFVQLNLAQKNVALAVIDNLGIFIDEYSTN